MKKNSQKQDFTSDTQIQEADFYQQLMAVERYDARGRKLFKPMTDLAKFVGSATFRGKTFGAVQFFNWFADTDTTTHEKNGKKYVEILVPQRLMAIFETWKMWVESQAIQTAMLKIWHCEGVFIRDQGKTVWAYPVVETARTAEMKRRISEIVARYKAGLPIC